MALAQFLWRIRDSLDTDSFFVFSRVEVSSEACPISVAHTRNLDKESFFVFSRLEVSSLACPISVAHTRQS